MINVKDSITKSNFPLKSNYSTNFNSNESIKLRDLYIELERKDLVIKNLQAQLLSIQSQSKMTHLRKLESNHSEQNIQMMMCQNKTSKELDSIIRINDNDSHYFKKSIIDKEGEINNLKQEVNETNVKLQNVQLRLRGKENELNSLKQEYEERHIECQKDKRLIESKSNQLIEIMKQYSKELKDYSITVQGLETEKKLLMNINQSLSNQTNDFNYKISDYEKKLEGLIDLTNENNHLNQIVYSLKNDLSKEMQINSELNKRNQELEDSEASLINKIDKMISIQKDNEVLKMKYDSLNKENNDLCIQIQRLQQSEDALKSIGPWIEEEIAIITEWISTYMGIHYDYYINPIASIDPKSNNRSILLSDNITRIMDAFKHFLYQKRNRINEEQFNYEDTINQHKAQMNQLLIKIDNLQYDNHELNKNLLNKTEEIERSKLTKEEYDNHIKKMQKDLSISKENQAKERDQYHIMLSQLNEMINKEISSILHKDYLAKFYDILCQKTLASPSFEPNLENILEDSLSKLIQCLRAIVKNYEILSLLTEENEVLKKEKDSLIKRIDQIHMDNDLKLSQSEAKYSNEKMLNDQVYKDKLKTSTEERVIIQNENDAIQKDKETALATIQLLEKRLKNMQTELELKEMQIKSQEQIINRRQQQQQKNNNNTNINDGIITTLESDKAKLIEDNVTLIKDNCILKETIKELMQELNTFKIEID